MTRGDATPPGSNIPGLPGNSASNPGLPGGASQDTIGFRDMEVKQLANAINNILKIFL